MKNDIFTINNLTVKAIRKLKDGNGQYIWQPSVTAGQVSFKASGEEIRIISKFGVLNLVDIIIIM